MCSLINNSNIFGSTVVLLIGMGTIITSLIINYKQARNARKLMHLQLLADSRQKWINELRDCVSQFIAIKSFLFFSNLLEYYDGKSNEEVKLKVNIVEQKIQLLVNPLEHNSQELIRLISLLPSEYDDEKDDSQFKIFSDKSEEIVKLTQKILKTEWNRIKDFD